MKSKAIIILFLSLSVLSICFANEHSLKNDRKRKISPNNPYYKFAHGCVEQIGGNVKDIDSCLAADWKSETSTEMTACTGVFEAAIDEYKKISKFLNPELDSSCQFKAQVKEFLKKKTGVRRFRKVFTEAKTKSAFDDIAPLLQTLYNKTKDLLNCALTVKLNEHLVCHKSIKTATVGFINTITNLEANIKIMIGGISGFIDIFTEAICRHKELSDAFNFMFEAVKATDIAFKSENFGKGICLMFKDFGSSAN